MKGGTWVMVANSACARVFKLGKEPGTFEEMAAPIHPASRLKGLDLTSDKPGRAFASVGEGRSSLEPQTSPKEKEDILFAREVSQYLDHAYSQGELARLYLAASPNFLGHLRQIFNPNISKLIIDEVNKDLTHMPVDEIKGHFPYAH